MSRRRQAPSCGYCRWTWEARCSPSQAGCLWDSAPLSGRLVELKRFSEHLNAPLNLHPRYFPVGGDDASRLIIAADLVHGDQASLDLAGAILGAVWAQERNIADPAVLGQLLSEQGLSSQVQDKAQSQEVQERYEQYTRQAIDAGVFGAPSYVVEGEIFWGQDRLDFLQRRLSMV
jgi:carboxymethylenebutenolidase